MDASSSSSPGGTSFVILSVSIVGILATSLLLLAYYLFLTRCGLLFFWRPSLQLQDQDHHRISAVSSVTVQDPLRRRRSGGLEEAAIRRIPTIRYRQDYAGAKASGTASSECAVCLSDFRHGERLRLLPPCLHAFHIDCIDAWLQATANCPLCRAAIISGSGSTTDGMRMHDSTTHDDMVVVIDIVTPTPSGATEAAAQQPAAAEPPSSSSSSLLPMRRSLSMDSSTDKRALQRVLLQQHSHSGSPAAPREEEDYGKEETSATSADSGSGRSSISSRRLRRSFFSFSQSRGSSTSAAVLPL
ncbi:hypothetical protein BAE44_0017443 [Dichanthelium oligosanthes]|uniref:RING-type E3 ubiquitin transferase n=1 Tax=Dichanthelium oligosanthes TaxID=888268 RepID=A0A1E5V8Q8_9POAL|nr:hypothetical protein BAE44_0017443 [Dichanthelium oligosanthes]